VGEPFDEPVRHEADGPVGEKHVVADPVSPLVRVELEPAFADDIAHADWVRHAAPEVHRAYPSRGPPGAATARGLQRGAAEARPDMNASLAAGDAAQLVRELDVADQDGALCGAAFWGGRLVVISGAYLLRLVPRSGRVVDRLETFPAPGGLACDGPHLWQRRQGRFERLDPRTGIVTLSFVPGLDEVTGFERLDDDLLVLHAGGTRLARVQVRKHVPANEGIVASDVETGEALRGLTWAAGELWSATSRELVRIDPSTAAVAQRLAFPSGVEVRDFAADVSGRFWCVDGTSITIHIVARPGWPGEEGPPLPLPQAPPSSRVIDLSGEGPSAAGVPSASPVTRAAPTFDRILVPVDFSAASRHALATALLLQDRLGSEVHLLHLAEQGDNAAFLAGAGAPVSYGGLAEDAREEALRFVNNLFPGRADYVVAHARVGADAVRVVEAVAREIGATLVLLEGSPGRSLFRTPVEKIARDLTSAVLVLQPPSAR